MRGEGLWLKQSVDPKRSRFPRWPLRVPTLNGSHPGATKAWKRMLQSKGFCEIRRDLALVTGPSGHLAGPSAPLAGSLFCFGGRGLING